jgi:hypothetical protein
VGEDMWSMIENSLTDCRESLEELEALVEEFRKLAISRKIFRRPNLAVRLSLHGKKIAEFQDKMSKSGCAMQTALAVINV